MDPATRAPTPSAVRSTRAHTEPLRDLDNCLAIPARSHRSPTDPHHASGSRDGETRASAATRPRPASRLGTPGGGDAQAAETLRTRRRGSARAGRCNRYRRASDSRGCSFHLVRLARRDRSCTDGHPPRTCNRSTSSGRRRARSTGRRLPLAVRRLGSPAPHPQYRARVRQCPGVVAKS
jgi:hypothetical protein